MIESSMATFRCWSSANIAQTVFPDIGALAGDADAIFLAAHTPTELEHRKGAELGTSSSGESRVLEALLSRVGDVERNTLVAVTGSSGSGKSHVVRWVRAHLPMDDPRFQVLYVPRAVQTLRELLRRVIEGLPGVEGADLMKRVDSAFTGVKPGELQERLISEMKIALNWILDDHAPFDGESSEDAAKREDRNNMLGLRDEERGRRDGLAELIDLPAFRESLLRPDGALGQLVQSYFRKTSRRDDSDEIFTADDLPLRARGIRRELSSRRELSELWQIIVRNPQDATRLLAEALRVALPKAVGLRVAGGDTLDSLFRASRKALRKERQELVLIFEDLAQFGLVDGELYDQFVTQPGEDLAPLRVIFAITDGPYADLERTVLTRIEHEFRVGGSALAQPDEFVGRYLNLTRVGRDETQRLWRTGSDRRTERNWMSNACDTRENGLACRHRDACHAAFGSVSITGLGEVGLYPYNTEALSRALRRIGESATPREVLDKCISEILAEADAHIANSSYPHERAKDQFDFRTRMAKPALLESNPSSDPERTYRALVIWGDESPLESGILDAFAIEAPSTAAHDRSPGASPGREKSSQESHRTTETTQLENELLPLFQWQNGEELPEDEINILRSTFCGLTKDRLQLDELCIHVHSGRGKEILDKLFNTTSFSIDGARGAKAGPESVRFRLTRSSEDILVMAAARWFRDHGHFDMARAKWQWPQGYGPEQLLLALDVRLDDWAKEVRNRFLAQTGGIRLAESAVGLYVVALAASGHDPEAISSTASALGTTSKRAGFPSEIWSAVDEAATRIVSSLAVSDYIGEFAAVRQGARGAAQLIDVYPLDYAIREFLKDPAFSLQRVAQSDAEPTLARDARRLFEAITAIAADEADNVAGNLAIVEALLEGQSAAVLAQQAEAVGEAASIAGFFRPRDELGNFRRHIEALSGFKTMEAPRTPRGDIGAVVRNQFAARQIARLADSLGLVQRVMQTTKVECERSAGGDVDVSALKAGVKMQVARLQTLLLSLEPENKL
ncbi:ATP-binding protein [Mycolicibacterium phocaicum]|uniref:ATP-binding protein n=1 Tax=Mycolicibacterium phocaicum TaxID=319706 RepID=UPI001CFBEC64|nr:ATP-binding protein [Mycolicibacterium phocaicum]UCZ61890.1 ATP-binding protein [Mycolicibacterium phocaicum]